MEYSKILERSARIVWENKYLILLGILAALGSGSFGGGSGGGGGGGNGTGNGTGQPFSEPGQFPDFGAEIAGLAIAVIIALVCVALIVGIVLWVISVVARGGLIASVDAIESGEKSSFSEGWRAGWNKVWTLVGIGFLPAIPGLILIVFSLLALGVSGSLFALVGEELIPSGGLGGVGVAIALAACLLVPIILALSILRTFAERACVLEDLGVIDSYRRGWNVLSANLGEAIILFVLQVIIGIVLAVVLFVPGFIALLCCFLWPLLLIVQGAITAFISAIWTLAWRTWTGKTQMLKTAPKVV